MTLSPDDPRNLIGYKEAMAGIDQTWMKRKADYFLDIADDGYTIASGPEVGPEEADEICKACAVGDFVWNKATNCLNECTARGCACSRDRNPGARDMFLKTAARRVAEVAEGNEEVCYASMGCGLLRFDFCFLSRLLALEVPVTAVHLVDMSYDPEDKNHGPYRMAIAQFATWFNNRNIDVHIHPSVEKFALRMRQAITTPVAIMQVDCSELTWIFDDQVKPMCEEILQYGGLFCSLTAREGAAAGGSAGTTDAWGEIWRLTPETGRLKLASKLRYRPGEGEKHLNPEDPLPPAISH